jgi:hypothetical protein
MGYALACRRQLRNEPGRRAKGKMSANRESLVSATSCAFWVYRRVWLLGSMVVLMVLCVGVVSAWGERGHVPGGSFGGPCLVEPCEGRLREPSGVAVSEVGVAAGDVYVVDRAGDRVVRYGAGGKFEGEFNGSGLLAGEGKAAGSGGSGDEEATGRFSEPEGIAVDNDPSSPSAGDVYVVDPGHEGLNEHGELVPFRVVDKYSGTGEYLGQITAKTAGYEYFLVLAGVAVDVHGLVWVSDDHYNKNSERIDGVDTFTSDVANLHGSFVKLGVGLNGAGLGELRPGLAVDAQDNFYVHVSGFTTGADRVAEFNERGELVTSAVDGESVGGVGVERVSGDVYVDNVSSVKRFSPEDVFEESLEVPGLGGVGVAVEGFGASTVFVADALADVVDVFVPEPPGVPAVTAGSESVSGVTTSGAVLSAQVNPRSEPGEPGTEYSFEYGRCPAAGACVGAGFEGSVPVRPGVLVASYEPSTVSAQVTGLVAGATYHFRVVAHNSHPGVAMGEERVFRTVSAAAGGLLDGRSWEMVSPPNKHGADLLSIRGGVIQAAAGGGALSYLASAPTEAAAAGNSVDVQVLARRGEDGWVSEDLATPHTVASGAPGGHGLEYRFFSEDLGLGVVQPFGVLDESLAPGEASEQTAFLRSDFAAGGAAGVCEVGCYRPLVTGVGAAANVPEGTIFGVNQGTGGECVGGLCGPQFVGASPGGKHVVLRSLVPLIAGATEKSVYEWSEGHLSLVSMLPDGVAAAASSNPGLGHYEGLAELDERGAVSVDGSRVVWSESSGKRGLYLRDMETEETMALGAAGSVFAAASADDSRIFFTDGGDLFVFVVTSGSGEALAGRVVRVTEGAGVLGTVIGASEDGSDAYFVGNGVVGDGGERGARPGDCLGEGLAGESCNLYVSREIEGNWETSFIGRLSGGDENDWGEEKGVLARLTARVSPNGQWLVFLSQESLSGYDNRDVGDGVPDEEVFVYDAALPVSDGAAGVADNPACVSCMPTGERPVGVNASFLEENSGLVVGNATWARGTRLAGVVPGWTPFEKNVALYQSRFLSDSGRLFFDSPDGLVASDTDGTEDVYEWEPVGVGSCVEGGQGFSGLSGGCLGLVSSGTSGEESAFLDASESGGEVFFLTQAQLSSADTDSAFDVYDARECTAGSPCFGGPVGRPLACEGDACQGSGVPPVEQTPGSLSFEGPGNPPAAVGAHGVVLTRAQKLAAALRVCRKDRAKARRGGCEREARKRYGPVVKKKKAKGSGKAGGAKTGKAKRAGRAAGVLAGGVG